MPKKMKEEEKEKRVENSLETCAQLRSFCHCSIFRNKNRRPSHKGVPKKEIYIWYIYNKKEKCKKTKQEMAQDIGENAR